MKYYILDNKVEPIYPQVQCMTLKEAHSLKYDTFPTSPPMLKFRLEPNAKFTDILSDASISASGFIINEQVKSVLEKFNLIDYKVSSIEIENSPVNYYWIQFVSNIKNMDWINFQESDIYETDFGFKEGLVEFKSFEQYEKIKKERDVDWGIQLEKITLKKKFDTELSLFCFPRLDNNIYISERIKEIFEEYSFSGTTIKEATISL